MKTGDAVLVTALALGGGYLLLSSKGKTVPGQKPPGTLPNANQNPFTGLFDAFSKLFSGGGNTQKSSGGGSSGGGTGSGSGGGGSYGGGGSGSGGGKGKPGGTPSYGGNQDNTGQQTGDEPYGTFLFTAVDSDGDEVAVFSDGKGGWVDNEGHALDEMGDVIDNSSASTNPGDNSGDNTGNESYGDFLFTAVDSDGDEVAVFSDGQGGWVDNEGNQLDENGDVIDSGNYSDGSDNYDNYDYANMGSCLSGC